jgi:hypothetical protein
MNRLFAILDWLHQLLFSSTSFGFPFGKAHKLVSRLLPAHPSSRNAQLAWYKFLRKRPRYSHTTLCITSFISYLQFRESSFFFMISSVYNVTTHFNSTVCSVSHVYHTRGTPAPFATRIEAKQARRIHVENKN